MSSSSILNATTPTNDNENGNNENIGDIGSNRNSDSGITIMAGGSETSSSRDEEEMCVCSKSGMLDFLTFISFENIFKRVGNLYLSI